ACVLTMRRSETAAEMEMIDRRRGLRRAIRFGTKMGAQLILDGARDADEMVRATGHAVEPGAVAFRKTRHEPLGFADWNEVINDRCDPCAGPLNLAQSRGIVREKAR